MKHVKGKGITDEDRLIGCSYDNMERLLSVTNFRSVQNLCNKMQCSGNEIVLTRCVSSIYHILKYSEYDMEHTCKMGNRCEIIRSCWQCDIGFDYVCMMDKKSLAQRMKDVHDKNILQIIPRENRKKQLAIARDAVTANTVEMDILHADNYGWYMHCRIFEEYSLLLHADIQDNIL